MIKGSFWIFREGIGFISGELFFYGVIFFKLNLGVNLLPGSVFFLVGVRWGTAL